MQAWGYYRLVRIRPRMITMQEMQTLLLLEQA